MLLACGVCFAEDAVSSATVKIDAFPQVETKDNGILVVYFSTNDTVRAAAYVIADALSAALFEIVPAQPYSEDDLNYYNSKSRSTAEMRDPNARPEIAELPEDLSAFDTVVLCYPIWGGQAPKIICTFLESVDLSGKAVIPFATSNSTGIGSSARTLQALTGDSVQWLEGKGVRRGATEEEIRLWAESLKGEE